MPSPTVTDLENQYFAGAEFLEVEADEPLLTGPNGKAESGNASFNNGNWKSTGKSTKSSRYFRRVQETIELDDIPPIIKSANGNILWADERCTRHVGLTSSEARLFLRLLQVDKPENFNYEDYRDMFESFGEEEKRLRELLKRLPWWSFEIYHQRPILLARVKWLERMREPRLWLMYLMARRRRILKQATHRVRERLIEKKELRLMNDGNRHANRLADNVTEPGSVRPKISMVSEESQTSETLLSTAPMKTNISTMVNEGSQTPEVLLSTTRIKTNIVERLRSSSERIRASFGSSHRDSHSRPSTGHCPVFDKTYQATREDIKRQVEELMPKAVPYVVIGWFRRSASDPMERILELNDGKDLFHTMRHGERNVRGYREYLSLKSLKGFGLYKCDVARGAHIPLALSPSQSAVLSHFFLAYTASYHHADETVAKAWYGWVQKNLNDNKDNPLEGRYSVQLIYDWSAYRLTIIFVIPLLLSLILGFWYMAKHGDVTTAWTISLYVVTAAAAVIALLAIIGSLKDV